MKQGQGSLMQLAARVQQMTEAKRDIYASSASLEVVEPSEAGGPLALQAAPEGRPETYPLTPLAADQLAARLDIPRGHFRRLATKHPDLIVAEANALLAREPQGILLRTFGGQDARARAVLSSRYQPLDNDVVLARVLDAVSSLPSAATDGLELASCEVTDHRLHVKFVFPRVSGEVAVGDVVQLGCEIRNSEVGLSRVEIAPLLYRLVCRNGAIIADQSIKRQHVGRRISAEDASVIYAADTIRADAEAFLLRMRDHLQAALNPANLERYIAAAKSAASQEVANPAAAVAAVVERHGLAQHEAASVLRRFVEEGASTRWALVNAVTRHSQDVESYDRATELEVLGGKLLTMPQGSWRVIGDAVAA